MSASFIWLLAREESLSFAESIQCILSNRKKTYILHIDLSLIKKNNWIVILANDVEHYVPDSVMGLTVVRTLNLYLRDCCQILSVGLGWSARCMGTNCRNLIVYQQQAEPVCALCLFKVGEEAGWAGLHYSHCVLSFVWAAVSCSAVLWYGQQSLWAPVLRVGAAKCTVREVVGRDFLSWGLKLTLIQRHLEAAVSDLMQMWLPVCQALSDDDWHIYCWQYKVSPEVFLDMWLFASYSGWERNMGFCSRCTSAWAFRKKKQKPPETSPGFSWLTASLEVLSSTHGNLLELAHVVLIEGVYDLIYDASSWFLVPSQFFVSLGFSLMSRYFLTRADEKSTN